jgi:shikimate kinase
VILKLKRTPGIFLVGFMGCGKTTIGKALAARLGWPFIDLDDDIEAGAQRTISDIFATEGEKIFRELEHAALQRRLRMIQSGRPMVLALGGGAFIQPGVPELLQANGVAIWLDCGFERIEQRIAGENHRPLARNRGLFRNLYDSRRPEYARAEYRVEVTSDDPEVTLNAILDLSLFEP